MAEQRARARGPQRALAPDGSQLIEKLIAVNRVSKTHKGGRRLSFNALVVIGDGKGKVAMALGKANEAAEAIRKGFGIAQGRLKSVPVKGTTIPHEVLGHFDACKVMLKPASPGTGIIAGSPVRAVCEAAGIHDILTKSLGSSNAVNLVKATLAGLEAIETEEEIRQRRKLVVEVEEQN